MRLYRALRGCSCGSRGFRRGPDDGHNHRQGALTSRLTTPQGGSFEPGKFGAVNLDGCVELGPTERAPCAGQRIVRRVLAGESPPSVFAIAVLRTYYCRIPSGRDDCDVRL